MDDDGKLEHERLPEPWVQSLEGMWEKTYGLDELTSIRDEGYQPIDEYLYHAWAEPSSVGRVTCAALRLKSAAG